MDARHRGDSDPPVVLPTEDLSGIFEAPGFGDSFVGSIVAGRYTVTQLIGTGGMGAVYRVFDAAEQRDVALKVLKGDGKGGPGHNVERFMREARVLSMLSHPNVVRLHDFGQDENGVLYLAMEMLQGQDLADYLGDHHRLSWEEASGIALQLVQGLNAAHQRGIVHRDLKPENVFLTPGRSGGPHQVKLLDFGIAKVLSAQEAKLTTEGSVFGTARYMSPEHASGEPVDARSDVYGVGILLYEMLAGRPPFTGDDFMRTAHQHVSEPPPPLAQVAPEAVFPPNVEALVMRALEKDKNARYGSMSDFEAAIQASMYGDDSTIAMVLPKLPQVPLGDDDGFEQTVIKSMPLPPPPAVGQRRTAPASPPMPPPEERTVIKPAPLPPAARNEPPAVRRVEPPDFEATVVRAAPVRPGAPAPVPVDETVAIRRPDPQPVGGTVVVRSSLPPGLPDFDDESTAKTMVHQPRMPPPQVAPPRSAPPPRAAPPPRIDFAPPAPVRSAPMRSAPMRPAPGGGFVGAAAPGGAPMASPFGAPGPSPNERPVFAVEQNANLMHAGLAPQRLAAPTAKPGVPDADAPSPEDLLRKPFNGGQWTSTEKTAATEYPEDQEGGGDMLLRPPERELSRNLVVAVIILSVLGLATLSFVLWQTFKEDPEHSVGEPHPAAVTAQPRPALFEPPQPQPPAFDDEPDDDDDEPVDEPAKPNLRPATKVVDSLSKAQLDDGFARSQASINACAREHGAISGTSYMVSFDVVDSRARNAKVQPPHNLTPLGKCVAAAVNANARFVKSKQPSLAIMRKVTF